MKKIKIIIEKSSDSYGAYAENVEGIVGAGNTVQECKQSILDCIETMKTFFNEDQIPKELKKDYELVFRYDTVSLLQYYKGILSNPAIEKLTGINQKLIHQYASGLKKPRPAQRKRIEKGLHQLGTELLAIEL